MAEAVDWGGKLTVMVNNAGFGAFGLLHEVDPGRVEEMFRTNVLGVIHGMRVAGEQLVRQNIGGGIVNISSIVGEFPDPGSGAYAASKAAVDLLSRTGYRELRDHGIHVVNVKPALTDTGFHAGIARRRAAHGRRSAREGRTLGGGRARVGLGERGLQVAKAGDRVLFDRCLRPPHPHSCPGPRTTRRTGCLPPIPTRC